MHHILAKYLGVKYKKLIEQICNRSPYFYSHMTDKARGFSLQFSAHNPYYISEEKMTFASQKLALP